MTIALNDAARTAALDFARKLGSLYRAHLGRRLIGAYVIGSLAHGGFSHRYSDIDIVLVTEESVDAAALTALRGLAAELDAALTLKLSLFWADRHFVAGRLPPLDRTDYLDHAIVLTERERLLPARPTLDELRIYLGGAPFSNWAENAQRFAVMDVLTPSDHKASTSERCFILHGWSIAGPWARWHRMTRRWHSHASIDRQDWIPTS